MTGNPGRVAANRSCPAPHGPLAAAEGTAQPTQVEFTVVEGTVETAATCTPSVVRFASGPITVTATADEVRIVLVGDIDICHRHLIRDGETAAVQARRPILIDARQVTFLGSSTLALFVVLIRSRQAVNVSGLQPHLLSLFTPTRLDQVLTLIPPYRPAGPGR